MDLEWFVANTANKKVNIQSANTQGDIGIDFDLVITDAQIEERKVWGGWILTLNGYIKLCFETWRVSEEDECGNVLVMKRANEDCVFVSLSFDDAWSVK